MEKIQQREVMKIQACATHEHFFQAARFQETRRGRTQICSLDKATGTQKVAESQSTSAGIPDKQCLQLISQA